IPALLPLYQALNMSKYLLLLLVSLSASIMNMVTWSGPLIRSDTEINEDPGEMYQQLAPLQGVGMVMLLGLAVLLGVREIRRINAKVGTGMVQSVGNVDVRTIANDFSARQLEDRKDLEIGRAHV